MIGNKYILDGKLIDVNNQSLDMEIKDSIVVYEVFTWLNNSAIFFDEHYNRILASVEFKDFDDSEIPSKEELFSEVVELAKANNIRKKNIRIDFIFVDDKLQHYAVYFIKSVYPTQEQYQKGVEVGLCFGERDDPKAKIANSSIREEANRKIKENNLYEVLLVNSENVLTEGSRSNVFFIKGDTIYTPKSDKILSGITRQEVLKLISKLKFEVHEVDIRVSDLSTYNSAFLTSTSMEVLPICCVGDNEFSRNIIIDSLCSLRN